MWLNKLNQSNFLNNLDRDIEINVVKDLLEGRIFEHWYKFLITNKAQNCGMDYEDLYRKALVYINLMKMLIEDISMQCPIMENFDAKQNLTDVEIKYLKEELEDIEWTSVSIDIVRELETKGDVFFQIYYDERLKKHRFIKLNSENMVEIIDNENEPIKYIYNNKRIIRKLDIEKGIYEKKNIKDLIVFTEGCYIEYLDVNNDDISKYGEKRIVVNTKEMGNMVPIIHIKGKDKREESNFSKIPSVDYIDSVLYFTTIMTDIRSSNRRSGSPNMVVMNGELDLDKSVLDAGGIIHIDTPDRLKNFSASFLPSTNVKYFEITNSLSSLYKELLFHLDYLYRVVGLIPPSLQEKMSTSDSSKAIAQFRTKQEVKNKYYLSTIKKGFSKFFALLLKDRSKKGKKRDEVFLQVPEILVTSSVYDNLLLVAQKMSLGIVNLKDYLKEQGFTEEQIQEYMENQRDVLENINDLDTSSDDIIEKNSTLDNDTGTQVDNKLKKSNK